MKDRTNSSPYSRVPFVAVRAISALSSTIIAGILAYFCKQLVTDNYKIPWTIIVVLITALITIAALTFTSVVSCCCTFFSPLLNAVINVAILLAWIVGTSLLTWNMYGALGHSCSVANWGNDRGVMVCNVYKILYTCVIFAGLAQIAQVVLDIRARRSQNRRGQYDKMRDSQDIKSPGNVPPVPPGPTMHDAPMGIEPSLQQQYREDSRRFQPDYTDESPGWRPGQPRPPLYNTESYTSSHSTHSNSNYTHRNNDHYRGYDDSQSMQMQDFSYQRPQPSTHYDSRHYDSNYSSRGHSPSGYGYQQETYYQGRY